MEGLKNQPEIGDTHQRQHDNENATMSNDKHPESTTTGYGETPPDLCSIKIPPEDYTQIPPMGEAKKTSDVAFLPPYPGSNLPPYSSVYTVEGASGARPSEVPLVSLMHLENCSSTPPMIQGTDPPLFISAPPVIQGTDPPPFIPENDPVFIQPRPTPVVVTSAPSSRPFYCDYLPWSIINVACCCLVLGVVALHYSIETRSAVRCEDWERAKRKSCNSLAFNIVSTLLGIAITLAVVLCYYQGLIFKAP